MNQETAELPYWIIPAFPLFFVGLWCAVCYLSAFISGWRRLAVHYGATMPTTGTPLHFRGGFVGMFSYRGVLHFAAAQDGLFVWLFAPFSLGYPRLFIPWRELSGSLQKGWMGDWVTLTATQEPRVRLRVRRALAEAIAAAGGGNLRISAP
jgi:hypothetical protein